MFLEVLFGAFFVLFFVAVAYYIHCMYSGTAGNIADLPNIYNVPGNVPNPTRVKRSAPSTVVNETLSKF